MLTSCITGGLSSRAQLHGDSLVSYYCTQVFLKNMLTPFIEKLVLLVLMRSETAVLADSLYCHF
jgi:hypothetical protein